MTTPIISNDTTTKMDSTISIISDEKITTTQTTTTTTTVVPKVKLPALSDDTPVPASSSSSSKPSPYPHPVIAFLIKYFKTSVKSLIQLLTILLTKSKTYLLTHLPAQVRKSIAASTTSSSTSSTSSTNEADSGVKKTADFSKIRYSQVWEDTQVLRDALELNDESVVFSIASAGDNVLGLLLDNPRKIVALGELILPPLFLPLIPICRIINMTKETNKIS
jgi:hypothetical protein